MFLKDGLAVWYKTKFGSPILATNFGVFFVLLWSPELKNLLEFMYLPEKSWNLI